MSETVNDVLTVTLNGQEYPLEFPISAVREAKKKYGGMKKFLEQDADELAPELIAAGVCDPKITEAWIVENVPYPQLHRQLAKIVAAFTGKTKTEYEADLAEAEAKKKRLDEAEMAKNVLAQLTVQ